MRWIKDISNLNGKWIAVDHNKGLTYEIYLRNTSYEPYVEYQLLIRDNHTGKALDGGFNGTLKEAKDSVPFMVQYHYGRSNPSKCNDKSFSASQPKRGTCTWHDGVERSATQSEYDKSTSRVRYGSPKGYTGGFAPAKGKTKSSKSSKASKPTHVQSDIASLTKKQIKDRLIAVVKPHKHSNMILFAEQVLIAGYDVNIFEDGFVVANDTYSGVLSEMTDTLYENMVNQKLPNSLIEDWIDAVGEHLSKIVLEPIAVENKDYDFKAFKGIPLVNQTVVEQCIKYFDNKKIKSIVLPKYILSMDALSGEEWEEIDLGHKSMKVVYEGLYYHKVNLQVENNNSPLWVISIRLSDDKNIYGQYSFRIEPKHFKKAFDFIIDILNVFDILQAIKSQIQTDHILYQFVKTLLINAKSNRLAFINVLTNMMIDCENTIVKSKDKGIKYRLGNLVFMNKSVALRVNQGGNITDFNFPVPSTMYATYALYMFNCQKLKVDDFIK